MNRDIADANPAVTLQQKHASSTGNILNLANNAGTTIMNIIMNGAVLPTVSLDVGIITYTSAQLVKWSQNYNSAAEKSITIIGWEE